MKSNSTSFFPTDNPWLHIPLADYEGHMALPEIGQACMLADQFEASSPPMRTSPPSARSTWSCVTLYGPPSPQRSWVCCCAPRTVTSPPMWPISRTSVAAGSLRASGPLTGTPHRSGFLIFTVPDRIKVEGLIENLTITEWEPLLGAFVAESSGHLPGLPALFPTEV
jgi:hypothetical protein